jgi:hypothetical protein
LESFHEHSTLRHTFRHEKGILDALDSSVGILIFAVM